MTHRNTPGFTLLEVLIAVVVLSFGMLGVGSALLTVHRSTASSYLAQQGAQLASGILERMRQNPGAAQALDYNVSYTGGAVSAPPAMCDPTGAPCTGPQQAAYDLWQWLNTVNAALPGAHATIVVALTPTNAYDAMVTVSYDDTAAATAFKSAATRRSVQLETLL